MISKEVEYSMIKQEIISATEIVVNISIAMYTITLSIFVLAAQFNKPVLFLSPYIILFPFQNLINRKKDGINRLAAYSAVFLEEGNGWESKYNELFSVMKGYDKNLILLRRVWNALIGRTNSTQLGILSTVIFNITFWKNTNASSMKFEEAILVVFSVLLFVFIAIVNSNMMSNIETRNIYIERLKTEKGKMDMSE